jgi:ribosomal protein S18 acetylase RimI-like enzyme
MTVISLRSATRADDEFCYQMHKAAMGGYVAAVWGWDERVQREYHAKAFKPRRWRIIAVNGADAGMLSVEYRPDEVYLARIEIRPGLQGQGIGTRIINALLAEARQRGQDLVLDVLAVNERARALYQRLGFTEVAPLSDGEVKVRMRSATRDAVAG